MNRTRKILVPALAAPLAALALAACGGNDNGGSATASGTPATPVGGKTAVDLRKTALGTILVDSEGRTLYLFEKDKGSESSCYGACAQVWPPYRTDGTVEAGRGASTVEVGTTPRSDGEPQVTYGGHPLYYYEGDQQPGQTNGQGLTQFGGSWYVLTESGNAVDTT